MPRPKAKTPEYSRHSSGQARVRIDGEAIYLGKYGTPESFAKYVAILAAYAAGTLDAALPDTTEPTVRILCSDYRQRRLPRYNNNGDDQRRRVRLLEQLEQMYGEISAIEFGPLKLETMRDEWISSGNCRRYCNDKAAIVIQIFKHGVAREICSAETIRALECLPGLQRQDAHDNPKRNVPTIEDVERTMEFMPIVPQAMIRMRLATGCSPSEVFRLEASHVDKSGEVWLYRPPVHKPAHKNKTKTSPFVGAIKDILAPYLIGAGLSFVNARGNPWNRNSYRLMTDRAINNPGLTHWSPYSLPHLAAQRIRDAAGIENAAALLGHSRLSTTEIYSVASLEKSIVAAKYFRQSRERKKSKYISPLALSTILHQGLFSNSFS